MMPVSADGFIEGPERELDRHKVNELTWDSPRYSDGHPDPFTSVRAEFLPRSPR
jgi:hypothetical protein